MQANRRYLNVAKLHVLNVKMVDVYFLLNRLSAHSEQHNIALQTFWRSY